MKIGLKTDFSNTPITCTAVRGSEKFVSSSTSSRIRSSRAGNGWLSHFWQESRGPFILKWRDAGTARTGVCVLLMTGKRSVFDQVGAAATNIRRSSRNQKKKTKKRRRKKVEEEREEEARHPSMIDGVKPSTKGWGRPPPNAKKKTTKSHNEHHTHTRARPHANGAGVTSIRFGAPSASMDPTYLRRSSLVTAHNEPAVEWPTTTTERERERETKRIRRERENEGKKTKQEMTRRRRELTLFVRKPAPCPTHDPFGVEARPNQQVHRPVSTFFSFFFLGYCWFLETLDYQFFTWAFLENVPENVLLFLVVSRYELYRDFFFTFSLMFIIGINWWLQCNLISKSDIGW